MMLAPITTCWTKVEMPSRLSPFCRIPTNITPNSVPTNRPRPPKR